MKKLILAACALGVAVSVFGQGKINFYNQSLDVKTRVYTGGTSQLAGNGANDLPAGSMNWTGFTGLNGTGFTAQLWAGPANTPESSLSPIASTTFLTVAAGAGVLVNAGGVVIPGVPEGSVATVVLRVWDNAGGTITSWALASAASNGTTAWGESPVFQSQVLGLTTVPVPNMVGLQSFNIFVHQVPEPSTFALAGLGAAALLIFRRRK